MRTDTLDTTTHDITYLRTYWPTRVAAINRPLRSLLGVKNLVDSDNTSHTKVAVIKFVKTMLKEEV